VFKRTIWFSTGAVVGLGSSVWVQRRVRQAAQRYLPDRLSRDAADSVRRLGRDVVAAAIEGRTAMREREAELNAGVQDRYRTGRELGPGDAPTILTPPALPVRHAHRSSIPSRVS
jgi:hypothetical protein